VWSGKHAPCRLHQLVETQTEQIEQLRSQGFVLAPELTYSPVEHGLLVTGYIRCEGGLYLQVKQLIQLVGRVGATGLFVVEAYSYKGVLTGSGTIFRYDSPHPDHNTEHHVHEYTMIGEDTGGQPPRFLYSEAEIPTLGDALRRLYHWYLDNDPTDVLL
jgi:hypothetical protein